MSTTGSTVLFEARQHLDEILNFVATWRGIRSLHFMDFFAGVGVAGLTFTRAGYSAEAYDVESNPQHDLTTRVGFFAALTMIMALFPTGLILLGPPCSLWVFMSQSVHQRTVENAVGDIGKASVRAANCLVRNCTMLLAIAHCRKVFFILEQPSTSRMVHFPWVQALMAALRLKRIGAWMRCFGGLIPKASYLLSNLPSCASLKRIWSKKRSLDRRAPWSKLGVLSASTWTMGCSLVFASNCFSFFSVIAI